MIIYLFSNLCLRNVLILEIRALSYLFLLAMGVCLLTIFHVATYRIDISRFLSRIVFPILFYQKKKYFVYVYSNRKNVTNKYFCDQRDLTFILRIKLLKKM